MSKRTFTRFRSCLILGGSSALLAAIACSSDPTPSDGGNAGSANMSGTSTMGGSDSKAGNSNQAGTKTGTAGTETGGSMMGGESAGGATPMGDGGAGTMTGGDNAGGEGGAAPVAGTAGSGGGSGMAGSAGGGNKTITLDGAAAKGPFINGSSGSETPVDGAGNPSGNTFPTQTQDDVGNFSVQFAYQGAVQLDAVGQWYNEVTGQTEQSPLTLHGLATVSEAGTQHAYINTATHLIYLRVKKLMAGGASLNDAVTQAETELRGQLKLGGAGFDPNASGTGLNLLGGDTDPAAYIFALSSVSLLAAQAANNITEQQYLNNVQSTFQTAGTVGASYVTAFNKAMPFIEPDFVMRQLSAYFEQVAFAGTVPNINRALDSDNDGVGNLTDTCVLQPNANQDPVRGLCTYEQMMLPQQQGSFSFGGSFPASADIDNDGDKDLVQVTLPTTEVFTNDGTGKFARTTFDLATALGVPSQNPTVVLVSAALGKIDADNYPDLVVGVTPNGGQPGSNSYVYMFPGKGDGSFGAKVTVWSSQPTGCVADGQSCTPGGTACCSGECFPIGPGTNQCMAGFTFVPGFTQLHLVDVNGDNKLDIVAARAGNTGVNNKSFLAGVILNPGAGAWAAPKDIKVTGADNQSVAVYGLAVGNFTADSNPDILALVSAPNGGGNLAPTGLYLAKGDGAGNFALSGPTNTAGGCDTSMAVGDFDEDTKPDVAFMDLAATKLTLAFGVGDGTFTGSVSIDINSVPTLNGGNGGGGGGVCPYNNSQNKPGLGQGLTLAAGPYTGGTHADLATDQSIFVTNGRSAPKQQFIYFEMNGSGKAPQAGVAAPPADADFNNDGSTDWVMSTPPAVVLINPPGYHSF